MQRIKPCPLSAKCLTTLSTANVSTPMESERYTKVTLTGESLGKELPCANFPQQSTCSHMLGETPIFPGETPMTTGLYNGIHSVVVLHTAEQVFNKAET